MKKVTGYIVLCLLVVGCQSLWHNRGFAFEDVGDVKSAKTYEYSGEIFEKIDVVIEQISEVYEYNGKELWAEIHEQAGKIFEVAGLYEYAAHAYGRAEMYNKAEEMFEQAELQVELDDM